MGMSFMPCGPVATSFPHTTSELSSALLPSPSGTLASRVAKSETTSVYHFLISVLMRAMSAFVPVSKCATPSCASDGMPAMLSQA
jgi:hypothetical protein